VSNLQRVLETSADSRHERFESCMPLAPSVDAMLKFAQALS